MKTFKDIFNLTAKTAVVTGGSRGLGLQIAQALGDYGARLLLVSRKQADLDEAVMSVQARGIDASAVAADLGRDDTLEPLVAQTLARLGHVDILINNAGASWGSPAEDNPLPAWDKIMNLNIRSIFRLSQAIRRQSMIPRFTLRLLAIW